MSWCEVKSLQRSLPCSSTPYNQFIAVLCHCVFSEEIIIKHTCAQRVSAMPLSHDRHLYLRSARRTEGSPVHISLSVCAAELGDYSETEHTAGYLSEYCFIPNPPQDFHKEVSKHHQQHRYTEKHGPRAFRYKPASVQSLYSHVCIHTHLSVHMYRRI